MNDEKLQIGEPENQPHEVTCSCGKRTVVRHNGYRFIPNDPDWRFNPASLGWYCGQPGHRQARQNVSAAEESRGSSQYPDIKL